MDKTSLGGASGTGAVGPETGPETGAETGAQAVLPRSVRLLQWLVIGLTASMIVGVITVVAVVVTRFPSAERAAPLRLPDSVTLPAGATPTAVTLARDWVAVVAEVKGAPQILIYDRETGALVQSVPLVPAP